MASVTVASPATAAALASVRYQVAPARLAFYNEDMPDATQVINVRNNGEEPLRVKLLCTSSHDFSVRPIRMTVAPNSASDIVIRLKTPEALGKHKFMVQFVDEEDRELANEKRSAMVYTSREAARAAANAAAAGADLAGRVPGSAPPGSRPGPAAEPGTFRLIQRAVKDDAAPAPAPPTPAAPAVRKAVASPNRIRTVVVVAAVALAASSWLGLATLLPVSFRDAVAVHLTFSPAQLLYGGFIAGLAVGMSIR